MATERPDPSTDPDPAATAVVAALVVTWNSAAQLPAFLRSLPAAMEGVGSWRLVVADNASSDDSVELVRRTAPDATVVELASNGGYAVGVNAAAREAADADAVLVLNPDVRLGPGSVAPLVRALAIPGTVVAVPRVRGPAGQTAWSLRRESNVLRTLGEAVLGGERAGRIPALGVLISDPAAYESPRRVDWASGCAMLIDRERLGQLGGLDESFFHGAEETDFCLRVRDRGWTVRYCPQAVVQHLGGGGEQSTVLRPIMFANRLELYRRRHGAVRAGAYRSALLLNEALRSARHAAHRATFRRLLRPGHPSRSSGPTTATGPADVTGPVT
jgi:GT2 family glycosyltransferase